MIFNEAIIDRKSPVVDFFFTVSQDSKKFQLEIKTEIPAATHLMPLLHACGTSRKEVCRRMKHVKISVPPSNQSIMIHRINEGAPIPYFWKVGSPTGQTYIDPTRETLMLNFPDLMRLYRYGGSIDLSKIKHIALAAFGTEVRGDIRPSLKMYEEILELIHRECPDITSFQMIKMLVPTYDIRQSKSEKEPDYRFLDLDSDMWIDDLRADDKIIKGVHREVTESILDSAKEMEHWFQGYLARLKQSGKGEALNFWEKVKYTVAFQCAFDDDADWEAHRKSAPEPKLHIFPIHAWIHAHADGTPLNRYKGLAQIFEGAPW